MGLYNFKRIVTLAHRYRRSTGCSLSMAMKAAWGRAKERVLKDLMRGNFVEFTYQKVNNGGLRRAVGTLHPSAYQVRSETSVKNKVFPSYASIRYFDTEVENGAWRSFRKGHLVRITSVLPLLPTN